MPKKILKACWPESLQNFKLGEMGALHAYTVKVHIDAHLTITIDNMTIDDVFEMLNLYELKFIIKEIE